MQQVDAALVELLSSLFGAPELRRLLQRETWGVKLVLGVASSEHTAPSDWFHDLVVAINQRGLRADLRSLMLREREKRATEIRAVLPEAEPARIAPRTAEVAVAPGAVMTPPRPMHDLADARPAPQAWRPIRVLHLSDLNFSARMDSNGDTVLGRLAADVARLRGEVGEIDLVVVTGDIATRGTAEEYTQATAWLTRPLAMAAGVEAAKIRVVPGNLDVDRGSITRTARLIADGLVSGPDPQQAIAEVLGSEKERAKLLECQAAYITFAQTFHPGLTAPWWSERFEIQGLSIHLAGLNSSWLSGSNEHEKDKFFLSRWQCDELLAEADDADLSIALLHHPWEYLNEHDQECMEEVRRSCGVILNGHLMGWGLARFVSDPERDVLQLVARTSSLGDWLPSAERYNSECMNVYQVLELDPLCGEARVHFRIWDGYDWIPDRKRYKKAPDGTAILPLRRSPHRPKPPPDDAPTKDATDDPTPIRTPRDHYAVLLKEQLNQIPEVFRVPNGPTTIAGVYVEVTLATNARELDCAPDALHAKGREAALRHNASIKDLRGRVPLSDVLKHRHRRWGLLGDPGGGKTTLLRHVAREMLTKPNGPLPIYLKVAELEHGLARAVTSLCASFNAHDLSNYLLTEAQLGRVVLLIDGLDEAVDLLAARRWVISAAADVGESQVVVASRPIGYTEPSAAFKTLTICPLAVEHQTELLTRWVTSRAKVQAAINRLSRTPRLRRLAENPLLLTLVGLLLRSGQDVPSRRGELYERALKLLLTRNHNNEDAPVAMMKEPDLTLDLLSWAALRLHGLEGEAYRRDALITALEADSCNAARLGKHWQSPATFIGEVAERTGLLIPDTGRVRDASAYSFPHRTFREFLAATALERDMGAVGSGGASGVGELSRVFAEGKTRPERWAEVLALTCGRLGPGGADALVQRITKEGNSALLLRVVADAEGISAATVRGALKLELGWKMDQLQARQKVIEEIPALVEDLAVAVGLLEQVAKSTTCGHDLFWVREVLRRIERGEMAGGVLDGSVEEAKRAAKVAADNVLSHLNAVKRTQLHGLLKPWWRAIPAGSFNMGSNERYDEKPIHRVTFTSGFQMLAVPVTWAMYRFFDPGHDAAHHDFDPIVCAEPQDEMPVSMVSWYAAMMFAEWVGARLPLEPEWEYACRAGTTTRYWSGDEFRDLVAAGYPLPHHDRLSHPVATFDSNAWGLHDVHGNVEEWCLNKPAKYDSFVDSLTIDPTGLTFAIGNALPMSSDFADHDASRSVRGSSPECSPEHARSASRNSHSPSFAHRLLGFRLVLCPPERS